VKLSQVAARLDCVLNGDGDIDITQVVAIDQAGPGHLTFVTNPKYAAKARTTHASAIIVSPDFPELPIATLRHSNVQLAYGRAVGLFYEAPQPPRGIDPSARISPSARIGEGASIAPFVVIEDDVQIGQNCTIYPFVHIARGVHIGENFKAYAHVSVREFCRIGKGVILQDGARIGTDGYGYAKQDDGSHYKIAPSGIVVLEDDVEVGANTTIDRATVGETRVRRGAKIDNLVQIAHASDVGEDSLLCAQVGLAGSTTIGRNVILAGQVGVAGHLTVGDGAIAAAQAGIPNSVKPGAVVSGSPAIDRKLWLKVSALFKRLPELLKRIEALEKGKKD